MKKLPVSQLQALFAAIAADRKLYIPAGEAKTAAFTLWREGLELTAALNTNRSGKDLFFPQVENLVDFKVTGKQIEVIESRDPAEPFVIFGVRACDCRSFDILDKVFLCDPVDSYYETRRKHAAVVTLACTEPEETCFCTALGIDPTDPAGDVTGWMADGWLYLRANTEKGEALLASLPMLEDGEKPEQDKSVFDRLPLKELDWSAFGGEHMMERFHSPEWASLAESCLGCGTCTFVCPTCQCYDVKDFKTSGGVKRFRCWDSCMYSDFTLMSAGQPRPTQLERFRQRFMHKLVYYPSSHEGEFGCVGCGRCLQKCPISMNIVKVARTLGEEAKA
ncbi:MAG: 4Fe-4S dicluster domain-containing protein [Oscillospiraceae bacterium]|nr:4Fe-4S dicluster domain-containing protein [Oscillospiraceae bacterium]